MLQRMLMRGTAFGLFRTYKGARILTDVTDELVQVAGMQGRGWELLDADAGVFRTGRRVRLRDVHTGCSLCALVPFAAWPADRTRRGVWMLTDVTDELMQVVRKDLSKRMRDFFAVNVHAELAKSVRPRTGNTWQVMVRKLALGLCCHANQLHALTKRSARMLACVKQVAG